MMLNGWLKKTTDMETKFNFNSQIATTIKQSERLLALGLKKETADMWYPHFAKTCPIPMIDEVLTTDDIPAWSLGRLIEMLPSPISISEDLPTFHYCAFPNLSNDSVGYYWEDYDGAGRALVGFTGNGFFAAVVEAIEWLIKEEYFPKEYLI